MTFALPIHPRRREAIELLDRPEAVLADLPANLADIRFLNRWFGGTSIAMRHIKPFLKDGGEREILDIATGSADIPLALLKAGRASGCSVRVTGLDFSEHVLDEARRFVGNAPVALVQGDARALPWSDSSFDVVTCCLALHHFSPADATVVLREMYRVARSAVVVVDLSRGYAAYAGTWLVTLTLARNTVTRHDGPLSVLRAYTPGELRQLASAAGIHSCTVRADFPFRMSLVARKGNRG